MAGAKIALLTMSALGPDAPGCAIDGDTKAGLTGASTQEPVNTIAQGMPVLWLTCSDYARVVFYPHAGLWVRPGTRHSLRPLISRGRSMQSPGRNSRAGNADARALFDSLNLKISCIVQLRQVATPDTLRCALAWLRHAKPVRAKRGALAGIEPALLAELDFESSASTSSATGAFASPDRRNGSALCEAGGL